jgi:hypothetical protein
MKLHSFRFHTFTIVLSLIYSVPIVLLPYLLQYVHRCATGNQWYVYHAAIVALLYVHFVSLIPRSLPHHATLVQLCVMLGVHNFREF